LTTPNQRTLPLKPRHRARHALQQDGDDDRGLERLAQEDEEGHDGEVVLFLWFCLGGEVLRRSGVSNLLMQLPAYVIPNVCVSCDDCYDHRGRVSPEHF
jgi:hypothetical protein